MAMTPMAVQGLPGPLVVDMIDRGAPERPIFDMTRYMILSGMQRKLDARAYVSKWKER